MIFVVLILLGLAFGSFANAVVWRTHEQNKKRSKVKKKDLSISKGRSMCVDCHHKLSFWDLIPVLSWLWLRGKCRYCKKSVSVQYPLVEVSTAALFIISFIYWPNDLEGLEWAALTVWLASLVVMMMLFVYDLRWQILPNNLVAITVGLSFIYLAIRVSTGEAMVLLNAALGVLATAGVFYAIFQLSKGKWIGGGDVKLAVALGIFAGSLVNGVLLIFLGIVTWVYNLCADDVLRQNKAKNKDSFWTVFDFGHCNRCAIWPRCR